MAASGHVESLEGLRRLQAACNELQETWQVQVDSLPQLAERVREEIARQPRRYWQNELQRAEQQLQSALEELHRSMITETHGKRMGSSDARIRVDRLRQRVQLCRQRLTTAQHWARQIDQLVENFLGRTGAFKDLTEQTLPAASLQLRRWIEQLERYAAERGEGA